VVWERSGTPFRQIFWSRNAAPANIVGHRWNADTEAFWQITSYLLGWPSISLFSGPNCPQTQDLASKISTGGGDPLPHPAQHGYTPCAWAQAPPLLGPRSRKPFPQIKIYHYTPGQGCLLNHFSHSLQLTFVICVIYTEGMLGVSLFKIVRCCIRNNVMAAMNRFLHECYSLIVAVVQNWNIVEGPGKQAGWVLWQPCLTVALSLYILCRLYIEHWKFDTKFQFIIRFKFCSNVWLAMFTSKSQSLWKLESDLMT